MIDGFTDVTWDRGRSRDYKRISLGACIINEWLDSIHSIVVDTGGAGPTLLDRVKSCGSRQYFAKGLLAIQSGVNENR